MCDIAVKVALSAQVTTARQGMFGTLQTHCHLFALEPFSHFFAKIFHLWGALFSQKNHVEHRKNSFELFGIDFMLDNDYKVRRQLV